MNEASVLLWILLALALGWMLGAGVLRKKRLMSLATRLRHEYFLGLHHLLSDRTDEALESFERALELDADAIDTHLSIAELFRRKGEVARAVRVHQNLLERPDLSSRQFYHVRIGLARDYLSSGLLDRAEDILQDMLRRPETVNVDEILELLTAVYQQEKEWQKAIDVTRRRIGLKAEDDALRTMLSHFYCELADLAVKQHHTAYAEQCWREALAISKGNPRALLGRAKTCLSAGKWRAALRDLRLFRRYNADRLIDGLPLLLEVYGELNRPERLLRELEKWQASSGTASIVIEYARLLGQCRSRDAALQYLLERLSKEPKTRAVAHLLDELGQSATGREARALAVAQRTLEGLSSAKSLYLCGQCGLSLKKLHWQCPKCRSWGTIKPAHGIDGE